MSSLQGYYGLIAQSDRSIPLLPEGTEMAVFKSSERKTLLFEDDNWHQKTQISGSSSFSPENFSGDNSDGINEAEGSIRRRQKHEILFSEGTGKGPAASSGDPAMGDGSVSVRKSSSASNLGEPESSALSIWPATSKWTLMKPDVIAKPIFDGFQKPLAAWRNKAALD